MNKIKMTGAMFTSILIVTLAVKYLLPPPLTMALSHKAMVLTLNNLDSAPSVEGVRIEETYPVDYQLSLDRYFNRITVSDGENVFYSGIFLNKEIIMAEPQKVPKTSFSEEAAPIIMPLKQKTLYLPYYPNAKKISLYDEKGGNTLTVDLTKYSLKTSPPSRNLCGNGICDYNENVLSCYKDCRFYITRLNPFSN